MDPARHLSIEVKAAQAVVRDHTPLLPGELVPLNEALDRFLSEDLVAIHDLPSFPSSTIDGYAFRAGEKGPLRLIGESDAGQPFLEKLPPGSAVRIMSGAVLPEGADVVASLEEVVEKVETVEVMKQLPFGSNIRRIGDDMQAGEVVLCRGQILGAGEIGLAAAVGVAHLPVHERPKVALLSTGDELVEVGSVVGPGQTIDSSRWVLGAALRQCGAQVEELGIAPDEPAMLRRMIDEALDRNQVLVISGGLSIGNQDKVKPLLAELGHLHIGRVQMDLGSSFTFVTLARGRLAFGLPGYPVSALIAFEVFVRPALLRMQGSQAPERPRLPVRLGFPVELRNFVKYRYVKLEWRQGELWAVGTGFPLLRADVGIHALLEIPAGRGQRLVGATAEALILRLPSGFSG